MRLSLRLCLLQRHTCVGLRDSNGGERDERKNTSYTCDSGFLRVPPPSAPMSTHLRERVPAGSGEPSTSPTAMPGGGAGQASPRSVASSSDENHEPGGPRGVLGSLAGLLYGLWAPVDRAIGAGIVAPPNEAVSGRGGQRVRIHPFHVNCPAVVRLSRFRPRVSHCLPSIEVAV